MSGIETTHPPIDGINISNRERRSWLGADETIPKEFQLHWAIIDEPNKIRNTEGAIYMWVTALDKENETKGLPRAYKIDYTRKNHEEIVKGLINELKITNDQESKVVRAIDKLERIGPEGVKDLLQKERKDESGAGSLVLEVVPQQNKNDLVYLPSTSANSNVSNCSRLGEISSSGYWFNEQSVAYN